MLALGKNLAVLAVVVNRAGSQRFQPDGGLGDASLKEKPLSVID
jgi:hypothetical protein